MITKLGTQLIAKFLLGQVPAFATHIAVGVGGRPASDLPRTVTARSVKANVAELTSAGHGYRIEDIIYIKIEDNTYNGLYKIIDTTKNTFSYYLEHEDNDNVSTSGFAQLAIDQKQNMDFEVARIPITSRGCVNNGEVTQIAFASELPSEDRLLVSEASLWSAGSNSNAIYTDSRLMYNFAQTEGWKYHHGGTIEDVPVKTFLANDPPDINAELVGKAFVTASDTPVMTNATRINRYEPGRYMSNTIMLRGDTSRILTTDESSRNGMFSFDQAYANEHLHLDTVVPDLSSNNPEDEIKLAFSVVSRLADNPIPPVKTRIIVEFRHSEREDSGYAYLKVEIRDFDIASSRYYVVTRKLSDMIVSPDFDWSKARVVRLHASCYDSHGDLDSDSYVSFDAMRFDNVTSPNPTYAMSGYSVYHDGNKYNPKPITKIANSSNYIEFRTNVGVI